MKASQLIKILQAYEEDLDICVQGEDGDKAQDVQEVLIAAVGDYAVLLGDPR